MSAYLCPVSLISPLLAPVQARLPTNYIPGIVIGFPFGIAADRYGRKPVLLICVFGLVIAVGSVLAVSWFWWIFPLRLVWAAWFLTIIGGGPTVLMSTVFSMLTDLSDASDRYVTSAPDLSTLYLRYSRTRIFLHAAVVILGAQAGATTLASLLMGKLGPWVPIVAGYGVGISAAIVTLFIPETRQTGRKNSHDPQLSLELDSDAMKPETWSDRVLLYATSFVESVRFLFENRTVLILTLTFFINTIGTSSINIAIQYASKRFSVSISSAGFLITIRAIITIIYVLVLLPFMGRALETKFHYSGSTRDLWLARLTVLCLPFGFILMSLSPKLALMAVGMVFTALGSGCGSLVRSIANSMVDINQVARLNGAISIVDTLGILVSGPLLAEVFSLGLRMGGAWIALPFFIAAILTAIASLILWLVKVPDGGA